MSNEHHPDLPDFFPSAHPPEPSPTIKATPSVPCRRWINYGAHILTGLGLLVAAMPIAWLLGVSIARVMAGPGKNIPFQEIALRRSHRIVTEIHRLPSRWQPAPPPETRIEPIPIPTQPVEPLTPAPAALNDRERQIAKEELAALQQEFETTKKRLFDLESKLGRAQSTADVESRLTTLEQQLTPAPPAPSATLPALPPDSANPASGDLPPVNSSQPLLETTELKITLPSDALFVPGEARLLTTAPELLKSIFADLTQYPGATILIGSHTDNRLEASQSVDLALQQANILRAYLSGSLSDYRWVTIGYGQSQPVTDNSTPQSSQRNRRIEIAIDRR